MIAFAKQHISEGLPHLRFGQKPYVIVAEALGAGYKLDSVPPIIRTNT
jgi:hypothetical protein